jgi:hypothetical protein
VDIRRNQLGGFGRWIGISVLAWGCAARPTADQLRREDFRGLQPVVKAPARPPTAMGSQSAAMINDSPVSKEELAGLLDEAAGAMVLREIALDRAVEEACRGRGIEVKEADVEAERTRLLDLIERDAKAAPADAGSLLERLRRSRGLGEERFARLLRRNAGLRKLIEPTVEVSAADIEQALRIRYGQKFRIRVIVTANESDAVRFKAELEKETSHLDIAFARRAVVSSTDASSARGGLLDPISPADQTYPESIRLLLTRLEPGVISPVVAVEQGFAIVLLDSMIAGEAPAEGAEKDAETQVRLRKQRLAMEEAARRLLAGMKVVPLSPGLTWSWQASAEDR